ncbi:MAG: diguanylate cyclase response regulator [Desulfamplus sp.]|nr:diguanylate cyclase response regulator [Desulfamplus sp.]
MEEEIKVLAVEDDIHFFNLLKEIYFATINKSASQKFRIDWIEHWQKEDIERFREYDVILLDHYLNASTGTQVLQQAMEIDCRVPIVFLTVSSNRKVYEEALNNGASGYVVKDKLDPFILESVIRFAIINARQKEQIRHLGLHDPLTGLPNRTLFFDRLIHAISRTDRSRHNSGNNSICVLFYIDLDGFKHVNDNFGHDAGDHVLKEAAQRLKNSVRETDTVARLGGDEFAVILQIDARDHIEGTSDIKEVGDIEGIANIEAVAKKIIAAIDQPVHLGGNRQCGIGASVGISIYPDDSESAEALMKKADSAMYQVKKRGKNNYLFYKPDHLDTDLK